MRNDEGDIYDLPGRDAVLCKRHPSLLVLFSVLFALLSSDFCAVLRFYLLSRLVHRISHTYLTLRVCGVFV